MSEPVETPEKPNGMTAHVRYAHGVTLNMGNYESARIDVEVTLPCGATSAAIAKTYDYAKKWVTGRIEAEVAEVGKS